MEEFVRTASSAEYRTLHCAFISPAKIVVAVEWLATCSVSEIRRTRAAWRGRSKPNPLVAVAQAMRQSVNGKTRLPELHVRFRACRAGCTDECCHGCLSASIRHSDENIFLIPPPNCEIAARARQDAPQRR